MTARQPNQEGREFRDEFGSLARITLAPTIWAVHFLLSYVAAAVACARLDAAPGLMEMLRLGILALTVVALAGILWIGWQSLRQWNRDPQGGSVDADDSKDGRHRFLGHASFLLAIISAIGVVLVAMPAMFIRSCL